VPWGGPAPVIAAGLHGDGPASHDVVRAVKAPVTMLYASAAGPAVAGPSWDDEEDEVSRWCRLLEWWGFPPAPGHGNWRCSSSGPRPAARPWCIPQGQAAATTRPGDSARSPASCRAGNDGLSWITGTTAERPLALRIARAAGLGAEAVHTGRTGLAGLAALVPGRRW
jgi:hypothetical protein